MDKLVERKPSGLSKYLEILQNILETFKGVRAQLGDQNMRMSLGKIIIVVMIAFSMSYNKKSIKKSVTNTIAILGGQHLTSKIVDDIIRDTQKTAAGIASKSITKSSGIDIEGYRKHLQELVDNGIISEPSVHHFVNKMLDVLSENVTDVIHKKGMLITRGDFQTGKVQNPLKLLNDIFTIYKDVEVSDLKKGLDELIDSLEELISTYNVKDQLRIKVFMPFLHNMKQEQIKEPLQPISPILLLGPPGTGKTKFVTDMAKIINASVVTFPSRIYLQMDSYHETEEYRKRFLHPITQAILKQKEDKKDGIVIFIDEIDKKISSRADESKYLELLQHIINGIYSDQYLHDTIIKVPNLIFIAAANEEPGYSKKKKKERSPLMTRFTVVDFRGYSNPEKNIIIRKLFTDEIEKMKLEGDTDDQYGDKDVQYGDTGVQYGARKKEVLEHINNLIETDEDQGVRNLILKVRQYIVLKSMQGYFKGTKWESITKDHIFEIEEKERQKRRHLTIRRVDSSRSVGSEGSGGSRRGSEGSGRSRGGSGGSREGSGGSRRGSEGSGRSRGGSEGSAFGSKKCTLRKMSKIAKVKVNKLQNQREIDIVVNRIIKKAKKDPKLRKKLTIECLKFIQTKKHI